MYGSQSYHSAPMAGGIPGVHPPQPIPGTNVYHAGGPPQQQQPPPPPTNNNPNNNSTNNNNNSQQKHDIFVGNLAFSTTDEQLHQAFSEIGRIVKVRMVNDLETGKPRGFAFIEFEDPQAALSAIRNMNDYELNGRRIRVNFSNSSHLETLAGRLGMDLSAHTAPPKNNNQNNNASSTNNTDAAAAAAGTTTVAESLKQMSKSDMHAIISQLKSLAETNPDEARKLLTAHPQLPEAILFLMSKLDMIKTPLHAMTPGMAPPMTAAGMMIPPTQTTAIVPPPPTNPPMSHFTAPPTTAPHHLPPPPPKPPGGLPPPPPSQTRADPRRADPRASLSDPRRNNNATAAAPPALRAADPRARADPRRQQQQPPPLPQPPGLPPPPPPMGGGGRGGHEYQQQQQQQQQPPPMNLDPGLVQQVMSLTPQQIGMLPVDKQQSILALRKQITGGMG